MPATEVKTVSFSVPGGKRAAGMARRSVLSVQAGLPHSIRHRLALLLSELVNNAIQHGGAGPHETVQVKVESSTEKVRVEVFDPGSNGAPARDRLEEGGGYGLLLVDRLADGWGRGAAGSGGSVAWFELALAEADRL
jgi:anti-sigma regulatory factor (Ser/Thr protein kinase)